VLLCWLLVNVCVSAAFTKTGHVRDTTSPIIMDNAPVRVRGSRNVVWFHTWRMVGLFSVPNLSSHTPSQGLSKLNTQRGKIAE